MQHFYPKELLVNTIEGYSSLPIVKDEKEEGKFKVDVSTTPFAEYEDRVIRISHPQFLTMEKVLPLMSYCLMIHNKKWLTITEKGVERVGLLKHAVNRGEESAAYMGGFNSVVMAKDESPEKRLQLIGYLYTGDKVIFLARITFAQLPTFTRRDCSFKSYTTEDFLALREAQGVDSFSKRVLEELFEAGLE